MPAAKKKTTKKKKRVRKVHVVAPPEHTFFIARDSGSYTGDDVMFFSGNPADLAAQDADDLLRDAMDINEGLTPYTASAWELLTDEAEAVECGSGVKRVLGLDPEAGKVYKVTMQLSVEEIPVNPSGAAEALARDIRQLAEDYATGKKKP